MTFVFVFLALALVLVGVSSILVLERNGELADALLRIRAIARTGRAVENADMVLPAIVEIVEAELPVATRRRAS